MMSVNPYYIVVVSCPDYMKLDEIQQQLQLPIRGCLAAKCTSRESWRECRPREDSAWQRSLTGFGAVPNLYRTGKAKMTVWPCSQSGELGNFSICMETRGPAAWAFTGSLTVPPRKTSDCDLLQMTRDARSFDVSNVECHPESDSNEVIRVAAQQLIGFSTGLSQPATSNHQCAPSAALSSAPATELAPPRVA